MTELFQQAVIAPVLPHGWLRFLLGLYLVSSCQIGGRPTSWSSFFLLLCYFPINLLHLKLIMLLRKPNQRIPPGCGRAAVRAPALSPRGRGRWRRWRSGGDENGQRIWRDISLKTYRWLKKHMERCSTSLIIREIQIKTIMRHHLTPVRKAIIKKSTNNECWRGYREMEHSTVGENVRW